MGWKAACILINERQPGYLGTLPQHDTQAARDLMERLGLGPCHSLRLTDFDYGMFSQQGHLVIGAYAGAAIVADQDLVFGASTGENPRLLRKLLALFPTADLLVLELHSVVNYFAYACYRRGELRRAYAGSADGGVFVETGDIQPEEQDYFAHSILRDGVRYFELDDELWRFDQIGENLASSMAGRFLGKPLLEFRGEELTVEEFERAP